MTECRHVRQFPSFSVYSGVAEVNVDDVLPCAEPRCPATVQGYVMITMERPWAIPLRIPGRDREASSPRLIKIEWERVQTRDGWRWSRR